MASDSQPDEADRLALYAVAVAAAALLLIVPRPAQGRVLAAVAAASALAWIAWTYRSASGGQQASKAVASDDGGKNHRSPRRQFASMDPELYTLRAPIGADARAAWIDGPEALARGELRNLALRGTLCAVVRRAARLGSRNGNAASGVRAMAALEDFFARYHRALLSSDVDYAARTLDVLRDTRVVALNALQEVLLSVPPDLGKRVLKATDAARTETLRCMSTLAVRHAPRGSPTLDAARSRWASPAPHDPRGVVGRSDSLF